VTPADRSAYWQGFRAGVPFLLVIIPFGMAFGVIASEAGFNVLEVMGFSILVIAGASQLAAVQLMSENVPTLIVIVTALAVNLRMAMYSASLAPHLGKASLRTRAFVAYLMVDQAYATAFAHYEQAPTRPLSEKIAYYFGALTPVCGPWYLATLAGAMIGTTLPAGVPIDAAVPITFVALIGPALRTLPHVIAAFVSVVVTLVLGFVPHNLGLMIAAIAAMVVAAQAELWLAGRRR
jgi:predicted branched-subunit amino acid permease